MKIEEKDLRLYTPVQPPANSCSAQRTTAGRGWIHGGQAAAGSGDRTGISLRVGRDNVTASEGDSVAHVQV